MAGQRLPRRQQQQQRNVGHKWGNCFLGRPDNEKEAKIKKEKHFSPASGCVCYIGGALSFSVTRTGMAILWRITNCSVCAPPSISLSLYRMCVCCLPALLDASCLAPEPSVSVPPPTSSFLLLPLLLLLLSPHFLFGSSSASSWPSVSATQFCVLCVRCVCVRCAFLCQMYGSLCLPLYTRNTYTFTPIYWYGCACLLCVCQSVRLCLKLWRVFGISDSHVSKSLRHIQHSKFMSSFPYTPPPTPHTTLPTHPFACLPFTLPAVAISFLGLGVAGLGLFAQKKALKPPL